MNDCHSKGTIKLYLYQHSRVFRMQRCAKHNDTIQIIYSLPIDCKLKCSSSNVDKAMIKIFIMQSSKVDGGDLTLTMIVMD